MRLKKLMSLVLACAMALSLVTVASAQDTKVYLAEDFDSYVATEDGKTAMQNFASKFLGHYKLNPKNHGFFGQNGILSTPLIAASATATGSIYAKTYWNNSNDVAAIENGKLCPTGAAAISSADTSFVFVPQSQWDFETSGETYVISFSHSGTPDEGVVDSTTNSVMANWSIGTATYFLNDDKTAASTSHGTTVRMLEAYRTNGQYEFNMQGKHNTSVKPYVVNDGEEIQVAISYSNDSGMKRTWTINGETQHTYTDATWANTNLYAFNIAGTPKMVEYYDNLKMYTIKTNDFKVTADKTTDVPLNTKSVRIKFSNIVAPATYTAAVADAIVVKADGEPLAEGTYGVSELKNVIGNIGDEIYSYVDVTFDALEEGTTYTVEFPGTIANEIGTALEGKNIATFTTKYPDVKVNSFTVVGAESLVADGSLQAAKLELINTTGASKSIAVIYAVYTEAGQLADVVYVNDEIVAEGSAEIEAGVKLGATGTLKAFTWDGMTALKPYTGAQTLTIAAAPVAE